MLAWNYCHVRPGRSSNLHQRWCQHEYCHACSGVAHERCRMRHFLLAEEQGKPQQQQHCADVDHAWVKCRHVDQSARGHVYQKMKNDFGLVWGSCHVMRGRVMLWGHEFCHQAQRLQRDCSAAQRLQPGCPRSDRMQNAQACMIAQAEATSRLILLIMQTNPL